MSVKTLVRRFKMGATVLDDPDPSASPEQVVEMFTHAYPHLRNATISEPEVDGDTLVYTLAKAAVQTKGADRLEGVLQELDQWVGDPATPDAGMPQRWEGVLGIAQGALKRPHVELDALLIPLA